ncbi:hypothetical protein [Nocardioides pyridinolyticus]
MNPSLPYDPDHHDPGSVAANGRCSWHASCDGEAVVSFQDRDGAWQSGCAVALRELVDRGDIEPLGQGA